MPWLTLESAIRRAARTWEALDLARERCQEAAAAAERAAQPLGRPAAVIIQANARLEVGPHGILNQN